MLGVGLDYIAVSEQHNMDFSDNGKDIVMHIVGVSITIFNNMYRIRSRQNKLKQKKNLEHKENR